MASLLNALIGEYRITEMLGAGGMGEVYKATHTHLGRVIAIKVLSAGETTPDIVRRFYSEASIQASLRHPGVAEYLGFYEYHGRPCILMEYVDGETLSSILQRRGPLPVEEALRIVRDLVGVVVHFHEQGVLHRDIKSSNIKITSGGAVKVLDFGIARFKSTNKMTRTGMVVGTPGILAPEQVRGETVTAATDVWQLGVLMFELLTARMPFEADNTPELYAQILNAKFRPVSSLRPEVPAALAKVVNRCLQKDPSRRFAAGGELQTALDELVLGKPATTPKAKSSVALQLPVRKVGIGVAGAVAVISLAVGIPRVLRAFHSTHQSAAAPTPCVEAPSSLEDQQAESRIVTVDIEEGSAQVFCGGRLIGRTPFPLPAKSGDRIRLVLRREGFKDHEMRFTVTENREFKEPMDRVGEQ